MLFIFSTPVLIRHLWQLKTVVFLHWCLIRAVLLTLYFKNVLPKCHFLPFPYRYIVTITVPLQKSVFVNLVFYDRSIGIQSFAYNTTYTMKNTSRHDKIWFLNTLFHLTNLIIITIQDHRKAWLSRLQISVEHLNLVSIKRGGSPDSDLNFLLQKFVTCGCKKF